MNDETDIDAAPRPRPPQPRGRGARSNVSGRFERESRESVDDGWETIAEDQRIATTLTPFTPRTMISYNSSPDLSFDRTINPYKGCEHGCVYCYARPNHAYLGLSPGHDFESRLFWKPDGAAVLARELANPRYEPATVVIGGDTDPYQPVERETKATRAILEVLTAARHPYALVTKGSLVTRDLDLIGPWARDGGASVAVSVTTLDPKLARAMEPRAASPKRRLDAIEALADAGVPVRVMAAPMIPGLNDHELDSILAAAHRAGASAAGYVLIRLPREIKDLFQEWLADVRPAAASKIMGLIRDTRGGADYAATWFERGRGTGVVADVLRARFDAACRRLGLTTTMTSLRVDAFRRPRLDGQLSLFDDV